jgi:hypothetical protein
LRALLVVLILGCGDKDTEDTAGDSGGDSDETVTDADSDGYDSETDCDDDDPEVNPDASEVCDGIDNNCDGIVDDDAVDQGSWFADADGDGYGDPEQSTQACAPPDGHVDDDTDCDDEHDDAYPGAEEVWYDGIDQDCAGGDDYDADEDGYTVTGTSDDDCNDQDDTVNPGAKEVCGDLTDNNCDGTPGDCRQTGSETLNPDDALARKGYTSWAYTSQDINGDGKDDLITSIYNDDFGGEGTGSVYVFAGPISATPDHDDATLHLYSEVEGQYAGWEVQATDLDNDSNNDLVLTTLSWVGDSPVAAYIVHGPVTGETSLETADAAIVGISGRSIVSHNMYGAGDTDGDGYTDLLLSGYFSGEEQVFLMRGPFTGDSNLDKADLKILSDDGFKPGGSAAILGDLDGDGLHDIGVGADNTDSSVPGAVYILSDPGTGAVPIGDLADAVVTSEETDDNFGFFVRPIDDIDNDGRDDWMASAYSSSQKVASAGAVYVFTGKDGMPTSTSDADATILGTTPNSLGTYPSSMDHDGDGRPDIALGAIGDDGAIAYLFYGNLSGTYTNEDADRTLSGAEEFGTYTGTHNGGDLNDDGFDELIVTSDGGGSGAVSILFGYGW